MTSLRTKNGISIFEVESKFDRDAVSRISTSAKSHIQNGTLVMADNNFVRLTKKGKFLADGIAADLFV
jgi:oxygen-independent coproporphyrinogen-3 oxidase